MDFSSFRVARKDWKWIFIHSERLGSLENEFLFISSGSEAPKMNFYSFRATREGRKWIFSLSEWLGSIRGNVFVLPHPPSGTSPERGRVQIV